VITDDSGERTSLASWRFLCAMVATLVVNVFTLDLVKYTGRGEAAAGFQAAMAIWGAIAFICFLITFAFTTERIRPSLRQHASLRQDLTDLFSSKPWITLFALGVLINVQLALRGGGMLYYFKYYLNREYLFGLFNGIGLCLTIIGVFLSSPLAKRFGKRTTFHSCLLLSAVLMALFAAVPRDSIRTLFALQMLMQLAFGPTIPLLWTMMADVADYSEWRTGRRSTALAFASIVFGTKLGLGIGGWLGGEWLHVSGYSPGAALLPPASDAIVMTISVFPAAALMLGFIILFFYPINDSMERQIRETLRARRDDANGASADEQLAAPH
jgi:GPH family glycoside/pentoside/hexuronide:cation symporter